MGHDLYRSFRQPVCWRYLRGGRPTCRNHRLTASRGRPDRSATPGRSDGADGPDASQRVDVGHRALDWPPGRTGAGSGSFDTGDVESRPTRRTVGRRDVSPVRIRDTPDDREHEPGAHVGRGLTPDRISVRAGPPTRQGRAGQRRTLGCPRPLRRPAHSRPARTAGIFCRPVRGQDRGRRPRTRGNADTIEALRGNTEPLSTTPVANPPAANK